MRWPCWPPPVPNGAVAGSEPPLKVTMAAAVAAAKGVAPACPATAEALSPDACSGGIAIVMEASGAIMMDGWEAGVTISISASIDAVGLASTWDLRFLLSLGRRLKPMDKRKAYAASSRL